jgi:hypothetical protein
LEEFVPKEVIVAMGKRVGIKDVVYNEKKIEHM